MKESSNNTLGSLGYFSGLASSLLDYILEKGIDVQLMTHHARVDNIHLIGETLKILALAVSYLIMSLSTKVGRSIGNFTIFAEFLSS